MTNPKRPCGHTKIAGDCDACAARLLEALRWSCEYPAPGGMQRAGSIRQAVVERYEAEQ